MRRIAIISSGAPCRASGAGALEGSTHPYRRIEGMKSAYVAGWTLMTGVALCALLISKLVVIGGKEPLEPAIIAILIGMALRNAQRVPAGCEAGVKKSEHLLMAGIVLMGAELHFARLLQQGAAILAVIIVTMIAGIAAIYGVGRWLRLPRALALLLSVGTTICGGTAIAIVAPILRAPEDETSYAIGTISLGGLAAIMIYPAVAHQLGVSDVVFGVFAGTAIHSTPQVVGAGFVYSEVAGHTATAVKLVRNCFIAPVVLAVALSEAPRQAAAAPGSSAAPSLRKAFPWFLFGFFILAGINTAGLLGGAVAAFMGQAGKQLMLIGMAGVGLNTNLGSFRTIGLRPLAVGLIGSVVVALVSMTMIASVMGPVQ
jgi:uncharacterized integral membrane protein (TIGR00698 family)